MREALSPPLDIPSSILQVQYNHCLLKATWEGMTTATHLPPHGEVTSR